MKSQLILVSKEDTDSSEDVVSTEESTADVTTEEKSEDNTEE